MNPLPTLDLTQLLALAAALGWASGMRLYLVVFLTGTAGFLGWVPLPPGLQLLQHPLVLGTSGLMLTAEFVADKLPGFDTLWDTLHTFIRIPAGAALAAGVFAGLGPEWGNAWAIAAALAGGTLAATAHAAKATTRAAANTSPEPFSNIGLSLAGDAAVPGLLWLAWAYPLAALGVLALAVVLAVVLIAVLFKFLRKLLQRWVPARPSVA